MGFLDVLTSKPVPAPPPADAAPAGDPLDASMKAAGIGATAAPGAAPASDPEAARAREASAGLAGKPTGEALIAFVESWMPLIVRGYAVAQGRVWDRECDAACRLSITERQNLKLTADAAAPYVARLIEHSEKLAALAFIVQAGFILSGKFALVKSKPLANPPAEGTKDVEEGQEAGGEEAAPTVPAHRRPVGRPAKRK